MDINAVLSFIETLPADKQLSGTISSIRKTVDKIYLVEQKEFNREKKEHSDKQKAEKRAERDRKRTEGDRKGLVSQIFPNKKEEKSGSNTLMNMLMTSGLLAGGGLLAWNYREEIMNYVNNTLKPAIQSAINEAVSYVTEEVGNWVKEQTKEKGFKPIGDALGKPLQENVQEPLQDMVAGHGVTKGGTIFTLTDLTKWHDDILAVNGGVPDYLSEPANEVQRRLKIDKSINDDIYRKQLRVDALEGKNQKGGAKARPMRHNELQDTKAEIAELRHNREQNRRLMAESWAKLRISDSDLKRQQRRQGRRDDEGYIFRQEGGTVTASDAASKGKPSGKQIDERLFSTTAYELGATRPTKEQRYQTGGLVLFQGHGDVPSNSGIAPGTDGPGTDYAGKYKPTAEQHFVNEVLKRTAMLAQKENVPVSYQRSTGKYLSASHPQSNWSLANGIRRKGGSAIEIHFDAYGMQNGRMIEGARGILKGGQGALTKIEKSVESKFGVHPSSGQGWGTLMLELDSLKYARPRLSMYSRMLVDAVKNAGASGQAPTTAPGTTQVTPGGTSSGTTPSAPTMPTVPGLTGPSPNLTLNTGVGDFFGNLFPGIKAFGEGFISGFRKTAKNPFAKTEKHQMGGVVGGKGSSLTQRFSMANADYNSGYGNVVARPVVVVKRSGAVIPPASSPSEPIPSGGGGLNMVEASQALHRIQSGSKY
jgi:hypothetical protein